VLCSADGLVDSVEIERRDTGEDISGRRITDRKCRGVAAG
jgi:hypothetical protein